MSHDQRPNRMRVVGASAAAGAQAEQDAQGAMRAAEGQAQPDLAGNAAAKPSPLGGILFIVGCLIGGLGLPLLMRGFG